MDTKQQQARRFTTRIEYLEEPAIAEQLELVAVRDGGSLASVIRRAVRRQLEDKRS